MGVLVEKPNPTRKPDMKRLPGKIRTRFERFWKLYEPVVTKYERKQPIESAEFKAAYDDAKKGKDLFYKLAETAQEKAPEHYSEETKQALGLAHWHMENMMEMGRLGAPDSVEYKPKHVEKGDKNPVVKGYQTFLKDWKYYRKKLDGDFGKYTEEAVEKFQKKNKLKIDGKIGKRTSARVVQLAIDDEYRAGTIQRIC